MTNKKGSFNTIRAQIKVALERGMTLTNGKANELAHTTEGGRIIRLLREEYRQVGVKLVETWRPNKLREGRVKEFRISEEDLEKIRSGEIKLR